MEVLYPKCAGLDVHKDVAVALQVSAYSLKGLAVACRPMMTRGSSRSSRSKRGGGYHQRPPCAERGRPFHILRGGA